MYITIITKKKWFVKRFFQQKNSKFWVTNPRNVAQQTVVRRTLAIVCSSETISGNGWHSIQKNRPAFVIVDVISLQHIAFFRVFLYNKKKIRECGDEEVADSAAG